MNENVATHPAQQLRERAAAAAAVGFLEARQSLLQANQELQTELVAQWLKEPDPERRERCWHEIRALEAVTSRLVSTLGLELATDEPDESDPVVGRWERLEAILWREPLERFARGLSRWRADR